MFRSKATNHLVNEYGPYIKSIKRMNDTRRLQLRKLIEENKVRYYEHTYATNERIVWKEPEGLDFGWLWKRFEEEGKTTDDLIEELTRYTIETLKQFKKRSYLIEVVDEEGCTLYCLVENLKIKGDEENVMFGFSFVNPEYV